MVQPTPALPNLKCELLTLRHTLELDEVVVRAISRQQRTCMLEVLSLRFALERLLAGVEEPVGQNDGDDGNGLLQPFEVPEGSQVAAAPPASQLEYGNLAERKAFTARRRWRSACPYTSRRQPS